MLKLKKGNMRLCKGTEAGKSFTSGCLQTHPDSPRSPGTRDTVKAGHAQVYSEQKTGEVARNYENIFQLAILR